MKFIYYNLSLKTKKNLEFIDITEKIKKKIKNFKNGIINIQSKHTTTAIILNESEPLLINDMMKTLERLIPKNNSYQHDDFTIRTVNMCDGECANGHAHCKALFLPSSLSLNIVNGKLDLGIWQRIFFIELDRSRKRNISLQIIGE